MKTRIRELREARHLSQNALAIAVNCSQNFISQIELGQTVPRADVLISIAKYFNTTVDYLLFLSEERYKIEITPSIKYNESLAYANKLLKLSDSARHTVFTLIDILCEEQKGVKNANDKNRYL